MRRTVTASAVHDDPVEAERMAMAKVEVVWAGEPFDVIQISALNTHRDAWDVTVRSENEPPRQSSEAGQ